MAQSRNKAARPPSLRVGQRVIVRVGGQRIPGVLVEDRGAIGKGGRHLWRVRAADAVSREQDAPREFEMPADHFTPLPPPRPARRTARL